MIQEMLCTTATAYGMEEVKADNGVYCKERTELFTFPTRIFPMSSHTLKKYDLKGITNDKDYFVAWICGYCFDKGTRINDGCLDYLVEKFIPVKDECCEGDMAKLILSR